MKSLCTDLGGNSLKNKIFVKTSQRSFKKFLRDLQGIFKESLKNLKDDQIKRTYMI